MEKTIAIRIDARLHKLVKMRTVENKISLKDYIVGLIANDLKEMNPLVFESIPVNSLINEASVNEAQKILDFVRELLASQGG